MGLLERLRDKYKKIQDWITIYYEGYVIAILCCYGFMVHFCPSQFFVIEYITETRGTNITMADTLSKITPVRTYSALLILLPTILLTDFVRYKPALLIQVLAYIFGYSFLIAAESIGTLQFVEFLFGIGMALEVAHITYGFASLSAGYYKKTAGYTRGYLLLGQALSAVIGEIYVSTSGKHDIYTLNIVSLVFVILSGILLLILPNIPRQRFVVTASGILPIRQLSTIDSVNLGRRNQNEAQYHDTNSGDNMQNDSSTPSDVASLQISQSNAEGNTNNSDFSEVDSLQDDFSPSDDLANGAAVLQLNATSLNEAAANQQADSHLNTDKHNTSLYYCCKENFQPLWQDFSRSYGNSYILKWSLWWVIMGGVYVQITWYSPQLWKQIRNTDDDTEHLIHKGSVQAVSYFIASLGAFFCAYWRINWRVICDILLSTVCLTVGTLYVITSQISSSWFAYVSYGLFVTFYQLLLTVASIEIASHMTTGKFALVFGFNNLLAGLIHLVLMVVFVVINSDDPDFSSQMLLNGVFAVITGIGYLINILFNIKREGFSNYFKGLKENSYHEINTHM